MGLSPAYDPLGAGGRETLLRSRSNETERRVVGHSKLPQDFIDRAEACERMAEDAVSAETRETMRYLALRWRMLAAEAEAEILASVTRKPTSERPSK